MNTLYLTQIIIDHETAYKSGLRDRYDWHQKIWEAFPSLDKEKRNFLTRLDEIERGFRLLMVSPILPQRPRWCPEQAFESKMVPDDLLKKTDFHFSLLANPIKEVKNYDAAGKEKKNGKRIPITRREDLLDWIIKKGRQHGFSVDLNMLKTIVRPKNQFFKEKTRNWGTIHTVEFSGILNVSDQNLFNDAYCHGIGKSKAFGYGMLLLYPLRK